MLSLGLLAVRQGGATKGKYMKTRIVYPRLWLDEKFAECKTHTKLLFSYLINNNYLGLSRYTRISDRQIKFDLGLNSVQIDEAKKELEKIRWCFFKDDYVYHNHDCAYVDYFRNEKVGEAKEKEIEKIKPEIVSYFNQICLNKVQTQLEHGSNLNYKLETINKKQETIKDKSINSLTDEFCAKVARNYDVSLATVLKKKNDLILYCRSNGKRYKDYQATLQMWIRKDLK